MATDLMPTYAPLGTACDRIGRALLGALAALVPGLADYLAVDRWVDVDVDGPTVRVIVEPGDVINTEDGSAYAGTVNLSVVLRAPAGSAACEDWDLERPGLEEAMHDAPRLVAAMREAEPGLHPSTKWIASTEAAAGAEGDIMTCVYSGRLIVPAPLTTPIQEI